MMDFDLRLRLLKSVENFLEYLTLGTLSAHVTSESLLQQNKKMLRPHSNALHILIQYSKNFQTSYHTSL